MTIKKKLILSTVSLNAMLLLIGMTVLFGYQHVTEKASLANDFDKESMYLQMMLRGLNEIIINEGTPESINIAKKGLEGFDVIHERLLPAMEEPDVRMMLQDKIDPLWVKVKSDITPYFDHYLELYEDENLDRVGRLIINTEKITADVQSLSDQTRTVVNANSAKSEIIKNIIVVSIIAVLLFSIIMSFTVYTSVTLPIYELNKIAGSFSKGDLDITMDESRNDEFGTLARHFNKSILKLNQYTTELQDFAHIASHDLQEPLRKVMMYSDRLQTQFMDVLGEKGQNYLQRTQKATQRMQQLIEGLLDYSGVIKNANPFAPVDLSTVAEEVLSDLEVRVEETGGRVEIENLPKLQADPLQMRQLFQNLIGNALKFRKPDRHPVVKVSSQAIANTNNGFHQITVEDNGIGFDDKYAERIFKVFQRLHGQDEYDGTGIGLSLCRKIVERHGGMIEVKSAPGKGTSFIITLPVIHLKDAHGEQPA